jgi:hypothetical protein
MTVHAVRERPRKYKTKSYECTLKKLRRIATGNVKACQIEPQQKKVETLPYNG